MPWIFNEDAALKQRLSGLTVDAVAARESRLRVPVRFRLPETEIADLTYPCLIIDHARIAKDENREHRGVVRLPYAPEGHQPWSDPADPSASPYLTEFPIPYNLDYQVTLMCRKAVHRTALMAALAAHDRIPSRFGALEIPEDGTVRCLDLLGGPEMGTDRDSDGKRLFTATYLARVTSELLPEALRTFQRVTEVLTTINDIDTGQQLDSYLATYDGTPNGP